MWELDHKKHWMPKNWCFWTVVLEKTLESPLDSKEIKPVNSKGNQSWIFTRWTGAEAEAPIHWSHDVKSWLIGKDPDAGKVEGSKRRGRQRKRWLDSITDSMVMNLSKPWEIVKDRKAWHTAVHGVPKSQTWLSDWTTKTGNTYCQISWGQYLSSPLCPGLSGAGPMVIQHSSKEHGWMGNEVQHQYC